MSRADVIWGVTKHARSRMLERFGDEPTRQEWADIVRQIMDGRAVLQTRKAHDDTPTEQYVVNWRDRHVSVVWAPETQSILTVKTLKMRTCREAANRKKGRIRLAFTTGYRRGTRSRTIWNKLD